MLLPLIIPGSLLIRLAVPCPELERSLNLKEKLENSLILKKLLLVLVLAGTAMVIADGVVTPAMSDQVVMISVAFLVILFSLQKYGTSKMGLVVGPALLIWFCCLAGIGIHNLLKYLFSFCMHFCSNFCNVDLFIRCCFLQLTFVCLVLPCLMLGYMGQAAYLMENHADASQAFYSSIPGAAFWPVLFVANVAALIASRTMTTATFSCIKQSTALGCFPRLKIIHTSRKFMGQIYIPVLNWFLLAVCLVVVCSISSINEIGNAYGMAELGVMMTTTILVTLTHPLNPLYLKQSKAWRESF
ncbi:unnamed protein product [Eruca vesicaria subsp. sativa]|uniref:K+ potassium transporter integral membrane domain-containing protein n=1 Tax=Eruca vesicaria subsp. sativa TaxID=29727 RepID=A0ABC8JCN1_ERUVS|nr:unnamed protein product [Eruca vesicaria subsp. sativa]